jgi:hypothetical protein
VQDRYVQAMTDYGTGALRHIQTHFSGENVSLEEMLATRRQSAGVTPIMALVEYAHGLDLPGKVFDARSIQEFQRIGTDLVLLHNDILSYKQEEVGSCSGLGPKLGIDSAKLSRSSKVCRIT